MCTAVALNQYFGRNLDYDSSFDQKVVVTPRDFVFEFKNGSEIKNHTALIGMAVCENNYPLYFDATNEYGLSIAGLNFPGNAVYFKSDNNKYNVASFEFIPWVLLKCKTTEDARNLIKKTNITDESFSHDMPPAPMHWFIADKQKSITVEQTTDGMKVYDNPAGVLTNNPTFDFHMTNLSNYMGAGAEVIKNRFSDKLNLLKHSVGMGGIGIPGDFSSCSRFVRAAFLRLNLIEPETDTEAVNQFFHILYSVYNQKGSVKTDKGYEITYYSSCCNTDEGIYYYTTYGNFSVNSVRMSDFNLNTEKLYICDLL